MKRLFVILIFSVLFFAFFLEGFTYYTFLSPESNATLEVLKEKHRIYDGGYLKLGFIGFLDYVSQLLQGKPIAFLDDNVKENDANSFPDAADSNIGDTFTGPSGECYKLEPLSFQEQRASDDAGFTVVGEWKLINQ